MRHTLAHKVKLAALRSRTERIGDWILGGTPGTPGQNIALGPRSKLSEGARGGMDAFLRAGPVAASKTVFDPLLQMPGNILMGRKASYGPYKGTRLRPTPAAGKGIFGDYSAIDPDIARKIRAGELPGELKSLFQRTPVGDLEHVLRRKTTYGGLAGFAQKHPYMAAGGGLLAYLLASDPNLRELAKGFIPGMPQNKIAPDILRQFSTQPSTADPFAGGAWR